MFQNEDVNATKYYVIHFKCMMISWWCMN